MASYGLICVSFDWSAEMSPGWAQGTQDDPNGLLGDPKGNPKGVQEDQNGEPREKMSQERKYRKYKNIVISSIIPLFWIFGDPNQEQFRAKGAAGLLFGATGVMPFGARWLKWLQDKRNGLRRAQGPPWWPQAAEPRLTHTEGKWIP